MIIIIISNKRHSLRRSNSNGLSISTRSFKHNVIYPEHFRFRFWSSEIRTGKPCYTTFNQTFHTFKGGKTLVGEIKYWRLFVSLAFWKINKILNSAPCAYKRVFLPVIFGVFQISQQYCLCHFLTFWFLYSYWKWLEIKKKRKAQSSLRHSKHAHKKCILTAYSL